MVSRRGVAKKRRKQEAGVRLTKCSLTVAASQQSWPGGNLYLGRSNLAGLHGLISRVQAVLRHNLSATERKFLPQTSSRGQQICRHASPRIAKRDSNLYLQQLIFRFALRAMRASKVATPDNQSCSKGIASFLCGRHFLRAFSSRDDTARNACADSGFLSYARQNNAVRNLSQMFLIAVGIEACA